MRGGFEAEREKYQEERLAGTQGDLNTRSRRKSIANLEAYLSESNPPVQEPVDYQR